MSLLRKAAVLGLTGLIAVVIGGMVMIAAQSGGHGGMAKSLLVTRPLLAVQPISAKPTAVVKAKPAPPPRLVTARREAASNPRAPQPVGQGENLWGVGDTARLVIVIDDIGHNLARTRGFLALDLPLTFSVLPGLMYSRRSAQLIVDEGREFLVHLPMEPDDYPWVSPGPQPLLMRQNAADTRKRIENYFLRLPGAIGASNHMGSAYTRDADKMKVVQSVLARQGRVFLNSLTSNSEAPRKIAQSNGFDYLERNIFLDNTREEEAIGRELERAIKLARRRGRAIAIGHPYRETLRVLAARFPRSQAHGVMLVSLSALR